MRSAAVADEPPGGVKRRNPLAKIAAPTFAHGRGWQRRRHWRRRVRPSAQSDGLLSKCEVDKEVGSRSRLAAKLAWEGLEKEAGGRVVKLEKVRQQSGASLCTLCLHGGQWGAGITAGHIFNKTDRKSVTPERAPWRNDEWGFAIFNTGVIVHSAEEGTQQLQISGRWRVLRGLVVPLCESCRKIEEKLDSVAQQKDILNVRDWGVRDQMSLEGLPEGATIPRGATVTVEDRRGDARYLAGIKQDYFLGIAATLYGTVGIPQTIDWWRMLLTRAERRESVLRALRVDLRSRATVTVKGQDLFPGRILFAREVRSPNGRDRPNTG